MELIVLFLVVLAIVLFALAAWGAVYPRYHLGWLACACLTVALLLSDVVFAVKVN